MGDGRVEHACRNCGAELGGPFCQACGQKAASVHLDFHTVLHEATHEFLHLDGKIFRTLKVLATRPGQLTRELVDGRRARHILPLRLYLTLSITFFFLFTVLPGARDSVININFTNEPRSGWNVNLGARQERSASSNAPVDPTVRTRIAERFTSNLPRVVWALMPVAALLTFGFYRSQPHFVAHLYYSVHAHSFVFLMATVSLLLARLGTAGDLLGGVAMLSIVPYHFLALRRFFDEPWSRTLWKGVLLMLLYLIVLAVGMGVSMMVSVRGLD